MSKSRPLADDPTQAAQEEELPKPVHWVASAKKDLQDFPPKVKQNVGFALSFVHTEKPRLRPSRSKVLQALRSRSL